MTHGFFPRLLFLPHPQTSVSQLLPLGRSVKESSLWNFTKEKDLKIMIGFVMTSQNRSSENGFQWNLLYVFRAYRLSVGGPKPEYEETTRNYQNLKKIPNTKIKTKPSSLPPKNFMRTVYRKLTINVLKKRNASIIKRKGEQNNLLKIKTEKKNQKKGWKKLKKSTRK